MDRTQTEVKDLRQENENLQLQVIGLAEQLQYANGLIAKLKQITLGNGLPVNEITQNLACVLTERD